MSANSEWKEMLEMDSPFEDDPFEEMEETGAPEGTGYDGAPDGEPEQTDVPPEESVPQTVEPASQTVQHEPAQEPAPQTTQVEPVTADIAENAPAGETGNVPIAEPEDAQTAEARKRAEFEAAEAKRKAEWEAKQQEKQAARQAQLDRIKAMNEQQLIEAATQKAGADTEKLTRRNMKECVCEHIQMLCYEDAAFAIMTLTPPKNMIRCFQYINRKAYEYVQDEMKANGQRPGPGNPVYGCDVPDDLCYQWAEEYFRTPDVKEDREEEEKFEPKTYPGASASKTKSKTPAKKKPAEKPAPKSATVPAEKKPEEPSMAQLSLDGYAA